MIEISDNNASDIANSTCHDEFLKYTEAISYDKFFRYNLMTNEPCVFDSWLVSDWKSTNDWVDSRGYINFDLLADKFGDATVPVADCFKQCFDSHQKVTFQFRDYLQYMSKRNTNAGDSRCLYLKDWHFCRAFKEYPLYSMPEYFASDWLNEFWAQRQDSDDDYRFVYMGPKGSWTPCHADVFRSHSWSTNVCGRKRWLLFPPFEEWHMKDKFGNLVYDVESPEFKDESLFPKAHLLRGKIEIIQEPGQTLFIPSNWFHQVHNLEDTISINHNWINGSNIETVFEFFVTSLKEVEAAISDLRGTEDWSSQCQLILKSTHGMDANEFYDFLSCIAHRRIAYMTGDATVSSFKEILLGPNHAKFDVMQLIKVIRKFKGEISEDVFSNYVQYHPESLIETLKSVLYLAFCTLSPVYSWERFLPFDPTAHLSFFRYSCKGDPIFSYEAVQIIGTFLRI